MDFYFYTQRTDNKNEQWAERREHEREVALNTCKHMSVYMQNQKHEAGMSYAKVLLKTEHLQFDIDAKDLGTAIVWINKLLDQLQEWDFNLDFLKIYASGSKGFHISIPQKTFGEEKPLPLLNKFHSWMATAIENMAGIKLDMGLYHTRHLLRIPNSQRDDGRWKVPVTVQEVRSMTPGTYLQYVQAPRQLGNPEPLIPSTYKCEKLKELWTQAKEEVKKEAEKSKRYKPLDNTALEPFDDTTVPVCIEWMRDNENIKGNYNDLSMQIAAYVASVPNMTEKGRDDLVLAFARNSTSDSKPNLASRLSHTKFAIRRAEAGALEFSCGGCRSVVSGNPCGGCPVKLKQESEAETETLIETRDDGYYVINGKGSAMRFTSFTLHRVNQICTFEKGSIVFLADVFELKTKNNGMEVSSLVTIPVQDWSSISAWKKLMQSGGGMVFLSSDAVLANLQHHINVTQQSEQLVKVDAAGIHVIKSGNNELRFWAEEGWSLDQGGTSGKHTYEGDAGDTILSLSGVDSAKADDEEVVETLYRLMHSNRPETVGSLLGWASACHLKEHLYKAGYNEFPLVQIAGIPGAGKTSTAVVFATLTGAVLPGGPMAVDTVTPSPLKQAMSQTTTIARIFDEFNKPNMAYNKYLMVLGLLKTAYCRQSLAIGYIKRGKIGEVGAATHNQFATAPVIYMSREVIENEELAQRSIVLEVNKDDHEVDDWKENFQEVFKTLAIKHPDGHPLQRLCKMLVKNAIETPVDQCHHWYAEARGDIPHNEHSRRIQNLFVIRMGLKFLAKSLESFPEKITKRLKELDEIVVSSWHKEEETLKSQKSSWGTAETLVQTLNTMAMLPLSDRTPGRIAAGSYYVKDGATLHLNADLCFSAYCLYTRNVGIIKEVSSPSSMLQLLKGTKYCIGEMGPADKPGARGWVALDLSQLEERGFHGDGFESI